MGKHFRLAVIAAIGVVSLFPASGYESKAGGFKHAAANSRLLDGYVLSRGPVRLNGISGNASGLTYNPESGTLFLIQNKPENIDELDKNGNVLRKIKLPGFDDTEGIDHIGGNRFVLVEEYRGTVVVASIDANSDFVDYGKSPKMNVVRKSGNKGFEGVTYVPGLRKLILAKEKFPA
ncbi:MAG: SdiA-regulated domain-containing protein, partial [Gammaproteobacteria bacterium]